jgi:hypothetical protein
MHLLSSSQIFNEVLISNEKDWNEAALPVERNQLIVVQPIPEAFHLAAFILVLAVMLLTLAASCHKAKPSA